MPMQYGPSGPFDQARRSVLSVLYFIFGAPDEDFIKPAPDCYAKTYPVSGSRFWNACTLIGNEYLLWAEIPAAKTRAAYLRKPCFPTVN